MTKKADADADLPDTMKRPYIAQVITFDVLYDIEVDADKVTVAYHCVVNMPFVTWLGEYALGTDMTLDISRSAMRHRPVRMIRECRTFNKYLTLKTE